MVLHVVLLLQVHALVQAGRKGCMPPHWSLNSFITSRIWSMDEGNVFTGICLSKGGSVPLPRMHPHQWSEGLSFCSEEVGVLVRGEGVCLQGEEEAGLPPPNPSPLGWLQSLWSVRILLERILVFMWFSAKIG